MKKSKLRSSRDRDVRAMLCMNSDPENSKWGMYAPPGGCKEKIMVDGNVTKVLCWRCTSATTNMKQSGANL
jgi:hypothetical protein